VLEKAALSCCSSASRQAAGKKEVRALHGIQKHRAAGISDAGKEEKRLPKGGRAGRDASKAPPPGGASDLGFNGAILRKKPAALLQSTPRPTHSCAKAEKGE